jgi:hypothetical protein
VGVGPRRIGVAAGPGQQEAGQAAQRQADQEPGGQGDHRHPIHAFNPAGPN